MAVGYGARPLIIGRVPACGRDGCGIRRDPDRSPGLVASGAARPRIRPWRGAGAGL